MKARNLLMAIILTSNIAVISASPFNKSTLVSALQQESPIDTDFKKPINDETILEAIDEIEGQLSLIELDKQYNQSNLEHLNQQELNNEPLIHDVDILIDDGFEDLDINVELGEEIEDFSEQAFLPLIKNKNAMDKHKRPESTKQSDLRGVGVLGEEEFLINQLDKSELVDIEPELDILLNKKTLQQEKIDELYEK